MDYKEKLKDIINSNKTPFVDIDTFLKYFPELKESEDERIRKELISFVRGMLVCHDKPNAERDEKYESWIAWLEKQDEQKPADKVEPKFKVGDWVIWQNKCYKVNYNGCGYELIDQNGLSTSLEYGTVDESAHLWTIQDAKNGDVLVASDGSIFLFKGTIDWGCKHYVALTTDGAVKFNEGLKHYWETVTAVHPATKEQRDTLEKVMTDAGYTFDFVKKELKKIEQKPAWSEEDEKMFEHIIAKATLHFSSINYLDEEEINFLKSLKDRYTWKPSNEQMGTLEYYMHTLICNEHKEVLFGLYADLKKLK